MKVKKPLKKKSSSSFQHSVAANSRNTQRAYASDWAHFEAWCTHANVSALPAHSDNVAKYLRVCTENGLKVSTVQRRLAAISEIHAQNRHPSPAGEWAVRNTLRKLRREIGRPPRAKKALPVQDLRRMLAKCPSTLTGMRDKAILLFGFCSALRRSELVALRYKDIELAKQGLVVSIHPSKEQPWSKPRKLALPFGKDSRTCPVKSLKAWLTTAEISSGPIFRAVNKSGKVSTGALTDRVIGDIVKKYCALIGKRTGDFSGYSLRTGFAVAATLAGASQSSIQRQTGHKSLDALRRYTGDIGIFEDHALMRINI